MQGGRGAHINGQLLTDQTEVKDQWKEHFESLFDEEEDQYDLVLSQGNDTSVFVAEIVDNRTSLASAPWRSGSFGSLLIVLK